MHYHRIEPIDGFRNAITAREYGDLLSSHEASGPDYVRDILSRITDEFEEEYCWQEEVDEQEFIDADVFLNEEIDNLGIF